jgi:Pyridine nucleotide-disulphide oxidoreductase
LIVAEARIAFWLGRSSCDGVGAASESVGDQRVRHAVRIAWGPADGHAPDSRGELEDFVCRADAGKSDGARSSDHLASVLWRTELASCAGLPTHPEHGDYDLVVLGAGLAGLTAAVYAASEGQRTLIVEFHTPGDQAGTSSRIENYPGFPDGVSGAELADSAYRQAQRLGAEFLIGVLVVHARPQADGSVEVEFSSGWTIRARSGLIATGVTYRRLDIQGIEELIGRGVRYGSPSREDGI